MLKKVFIFLLCQVMLFLSPMPAIAEPHNAPSDELQSTLIQLKKIQILHGNFLQQKNLQILTRPFVSKGRLSFSRKEGDLYWEILEPLQARYLINDKGIKALKSSEEGAVKTVAFPFADNIGKLFAAILTGNIDELSSYFDISYSGSTSDWLIQLKPENRYVEKVIDYIEVSGKEYITKITIRESSGDTTDIKFSDINAQIESELRVEAP